MAKGVILTRDGLQLVAKLASSETPLIFTRAAVGTGSVPSGYDPGSMTDLNKFQMDGEISSISSSGETASVVFQVSSIGVKVGFTITEEGLFADDPDKGEILFAYLDLSDDPQYIYAENSTISKFFESTMTVVVGTVENITAKISPEGLITRKQLEDEVLNPPFDASGSVAGINNFTEFLASIKSKMPLYDLLRNLKGGLKYVLHVDQLVSETDNDSSDLPAAAAAISKVQKQIDRSRSVIEINLPAAGWSGSAAPFTQTVTVAGITADMEPTLVSALPDGANAAIQKAYSKAFAIISAGTGTTGNGTVTFKTYKKPATDCKVGLKGV